MKKLFLVLSMICLSLTVFAQADKGRSSFGFNLGYAFDSEQATLGLDYRYCLTDEVRLNPGLTYLVKNHGVSAWMIDVNAHYVFGTGICQKTYLAHFTSSLHSYRVNCP